MSLIANGVLEDPSLPIDLATPDGVAGPVSAWFFSTDGPGRRGGVGERFLELWPDHFPCSSLASSRFTFCARTAMSGNNHDSVAVSVCMLRVCVWTVG